MIFYHKIFNISTQINCLSLAEAPGGFIQSLLNYKSQINKIYASSLLSEDKSVPYWNRKIINHKLIEFVYGTTNNGDLQDINNLLSLIGLLKNKKIYLITADGGFDYTNDYNKQEKDSLPLIHSEILLALCTQKKGGTFICKLFDMFLKETNIFIYYLTLSYDSIYFHKPAVSRYSNSEKYIVCLGFKGYNKEIINTLFRLFVTPGDYYCDTNFIKEIYSFNELYLKKQKDKIEEGVDLLDKNINIFPSEKQITKTLKWCVENDIEINNKCFYLNG